ncbi:MAG TPA: sigma-70 family RNA polymerase sigma factor [Polyangiaceae bacterium]|nr:sigma-70 family RNA polymerase sigma factor [Polyangiaceae bacterium]
MLSSSAIVTPPAPPLSDADLLARVAGRDRDALAARRAEAEFYARHARYLYAVLLRRAKAPLALEGSEVEDLVQETFYRAFQRAHTFDRGQALDGEELSRRARGWLGRIAQNLLADWLSGRHEVAASPFLETVPGRDVDAPPSSRSPRVRLVQEALDQLSERERDVLRVSALYHRPGEEHQRLPNAVAAELAARWNTSSENVRAIRSRAMKKLRDYLGAHDAVPAEGT